MLSTKLENYVQGTCMEMCPKPERDLRQRERLLHQFEMKSGTEKNSPPLADPLKTVKEYSRSAAGHAAQKASELRPLPVLKSTTTYLIRFALENCKRPNWNIVYDFVADRLRAVRKDLVVQGLHGQDVLPVLEPMVFFHVYAGYRLCESKAAEFDAKLNYDLLMDCLRRILDIYDFPCESNLRDLIESIFALHSIHSPEGLLRLISLPSTNRTKLTSMATKIIFAYSLGNYARVFHLFKSLYPPLACIMAQHLSTIRRRALLIMSTAYSSKILTIPADCLASLLLLANAERAIFEAKNYGINCDGGQIHFQKGIFNLQSKLIPHTRLLELDIESKMEEFLSNYMNTVK